MADVKHCTASPSNDFEGFLHIFYCRLKKVYRIIDWETSSWLTGGVQYNRNSPHDVRSTDCQILTQTYSPNLFSSRFWRVVVSFTAITSKVVSLGPCSWGGVGDTTLCDSQWFSLVLSTNKIDCRDITEILLNHQKPNLNETSYYFAFVDNFVLFL